MSDIVLVHSPLVGPSFWTPAARVLERQGSRSYVPIPEATGGGITPWRDWAARLTDALPPCP